MPGPGSKEEQQSYTQAGSSQNTAIWLLEGFTYGQLLNTQVKHNQFTSTR